MQHPRQVDVADIAAATAQQTLYVGTRNPLSDQRVGPFSNRHRLPSPSKLRSAFRALPHHRLDRIDDRLVTGTPAKISGHQFTDIAATGDLARGENLVRRQQHARRAEAALGGVARGERDLQIGQCSAVGQPFNRIDPLAVRLHREHQATAHHLAVDQHGAGAAYAVLASQMRARELQLFAKEVRQMLARLDPPAHRRAVDRGLDLDVELHLRIRR